MQNNGTSKSKTLKKKTSKLHSVNIISLKHLIRYSAWNGNNRFLWHILTYLNKESQFFLKSNSIKSFIDNIRHHPFYSMNKKLYMDNVSYVFLFFCLNPWDQLSMKSVNLHFHGGICLESWFLLMFFGSKSDVQMGRSF